MQTCFCDRFMSSHSSVTRYTTILLYGGAMVRDKKWSGASRTLPQFQKGMVPLVACNKQDTMLRISLSFLCRAQKLALRIAKTVIIISYTRKKKEIRSLVWHGEDVATQRPRNPVSCAVVVTFSFRSGKLQTVKSFFSPAKRSDILPPTSRWKSHVWRLNGFPCFI